MAYIAGESSVTASIAADKMWSRLNDAAITFFQSNSGKDWTNTEFADQLELYLTSLSDSTLEGFAKRGVNSIHSKARAAVGEVAAAHGVATRAMRSAIMDENTCIECERLDGYVVDIDSDDFIELMPPAKCLGSDRCRCFWLILDPENDVPDEPDLLQANEAVYDHIDLAKPFFDTENRHVVQPAFRDALQQVREVAGNLGLNPTSSLTTELANKLGISVADFGVAANPAASLFRTVGRAEVAISDVGFGTSALEATPYWSLEEFLKNPKRFRDIGADPPLVLKAPDGKYYTVNDAGQLVAARFSGSTTMHVQVVELKITGKAITVRTPTGSTTWGPGGKPGTPPVVPPKPPPLPPKPPPVPPTPVPAPKPPEVPKPVVRPPATPEAPPPSLAGMGDDLPDKMPEPDRYTVPAGQVAPPHLDPLDVDPENWDVLLSSLSQRPVGFVDLQDPAIVRAITKMPPEYQKRMYSDLGIDVTTQKYSHSLLDDAHNVNADPPRSGVQYEIPELVAEIDRLKRMFPEFDVTSNFRLYYRELTGTGASFFYDKMTAIVINSKTSAAFARAQRAADTSIMMRRTTPMGSHMLRHSALYLDESPAASLMRHEAAHALDNHSPGMNATNDRTWQNLFHKYRPEMKNGEIVSVYAATNEREFFAEAFSMWTSPFYRVGDLPEDIVIGMKRLLGNIRFRRRTK